MLWFNFILGLKFIFFCFKLFIIHYHTQRLLKIKVKARIKLSHNILSQTRSTRSLVPAVAQAIVCLVFIEMPIQPSSTLFEFRIMVQLVIGHFGVA